MRGMGENASNAGALEDATSAFRVFAAWDSDVPYSGQRQ